MFESGQFADGRVLLSAELVFRFESYWALVYERRQTRADVRLPLHALGSRFDRVWQCMTEDGRPSPSRDTTRVCVVEPGLLELLKNRSGFLKRARSALLAGPYFNAGERIALAAALKVGTPPSPEVSRLEEDRASYNAFARKGRDRRFKVEVVIRYGFTCALTGYRLTTERGNIVEAAHIHQRAESLNDDPGNGLALTPSAHWMFDAGLWTVNEKQQIIVASARKFNEWSMPGGFQLAAVTGRGLFFRDGCSFRPNWGHFEWHRKHIFIG
ncbi:MAG: HNH endonuclease [Verrucomicrobia bacterium]|nr:HNH endonuclease [Verrucomicrobiota bacterium]